MTLDTLLPTLAGVGQEAGAPADPRLALDVPRGEAQAGPLPDAAHQPPAHHQLARQVEAARAQQRPEVVQPPHAPGLGRVEDARAGPRRVALHVRVHGETEPRPAHSHAHAHGVPRPVRQAARPHRLYLAAEVGGPQLEPELTRGREQQLDAVRVAAAADQLAAAGAGAEGESQERARVQPEAGCQGDVGGAPPEERLGLCRLSLDIIQR